MDDARVFRPLAGEGRWYRGNLHAHSTLSDGRLTSQELAAAYQARGYDFLALSEHLLYSDYPEVPGAGFLLLPACEYNFAMSGDDRREFHFNLIGGSVAMRAEATAAPYRHMERLSPARMRGDYGVVQAFIDEAASRGCLVMLNHPHWSLNELEDLLPLSGIFAMEIYNHSSHHVENMGVSTIMWDSILRRGGRLWGTATDDNHNNYSLNSPYSDSFGGWVSVKAEALTADAIAGALREGRFYSSTGPSISVFEVDQGKVLFECSPVERIYLVGDQRQYQCSMCRSGEDGLTQFMGRLSGSESYVRMECVRSDGRRAYTNPIFLA
jgi:predicted metal-dependent phosphoesterase TrpH